jgi:serine/threonine protein kinase/tetratricopeptide (TPR) repeat protein
MGSGQPLPDSVSAALGRGAIMGRYVVLGLVGRGGMGEVYGAYDPDLNRKVAVKLLHIKPGNGVTLSEGRQRTLREAQAIARLSHPNVVVVYDVGTFEDKVFIAMEFVEGETVSHWLKVQPRPWQEIVKVFVAAGRGLAAAHDKGLVHRDFKPDNVMVGYDNQVRVMDFGLARQSNHNPRPARTPPEPISIAITSSLSGGGRDTLPLNEGVAHRRATLHEVSSDVLEMNLTRTGAMMGTPIYMAPEQFRGLSIDARTDQFSFCISLYQALYDERPFVGDNLTALAGNVVEGNVRSAPAKSRVPFWLRRVLLRGLRPRPADRWASMEALIDALGRNPTARRRGWVFACGAAIVLATVGLGVRPMLTEKSKICFGGPDKLAGIWDLSPAGGAEPIRHTQIREAFLKTGKSYAPDVFATVSRTLTDYAQRWASMYRETCEATQLRGDQSPEVLDLRMSCLQDRREGLRALTDILSDANGEVVENAVSAANALGTVERCANLPLLRAVVQPPENPATRAKVNDLRIRLADLKARFDAGRWKEALKNLPGLLSAARALGYQPLLAETLQIQGNMLISAGDSVAAEKSLIEAYWRADASRHDELRAEAAEKLVFVVGFQEGHFDEADQWATAARSVLERLGGHELLQAWLLNDLGCVYYLRGQRDAAVQAMKEGLALKEKALGPEHPDVGLSEGNLGLALKELGRNDEALTHTDRAIALQERALGAGHPDFASDLSNRGEILNALGRYQEAIQSFQRARAAWERELGPDNLNLAYALTGIGVSQNAEGRPVSALAPLERAFRIRAVQETEPSRRAETSFALAQALWESNRDRARAYSLAEQARDEYAKAGAKAKLTDVAKWLADHERS